MKASSLVAVALLATSFAACQRQGAPERSAAASPASSPRGPAASPAAQDTRAVRPAEAAPAAQGRSSTSRVLPPAAEPAAAPPPPAGTEAQGAPATGAAPPPAEAPLVVPAGAKLAVRLAETLASDKSEAEQQVLAELAEDVRAGGRVALPAGSEVVGHVVIAQQSGRVKGRARLVVAFDEIRSGGRTYPIEATRWDVTAESSRSRDAKIAGGAAAAGVIIGAIAGGGSGALKGGLIGGAAGGAAVLVTRGKEVELRSGVPHTITLRKALRVE